jgi:capsular polysaccharide export protein
MMFSTAKAHPPGATDETQADVVFDAYAKPPESRGRILLLQGPVGPFFARLHTALIRAGHDVLRVCFHAADRPLLRRQGLAHFSGDTTEWHRWLHKALGQDGFATIILFGADRPLHRVARALAVQYGTRVICLEEGYIRPGFITLEDGGNNAASPIAARMPSPGAIVPAEEPPAPAPHRIGWMCVHAARYYLHRALTATPAQRALFHRHTPILRESRLWLRNLWRRHGGMRRAKALTQTLVQHHAGAYYLVALQVGTDANLAFHANGWTSPRLIRETMVSFARHAPVQARLVFKIHPMDRGHCTLTPMIHDLAGICGVAGRVDVINAGSLGRLASDAAGVITINSTSGLSAIYHGVPLLTLGRAVYAHPDLCQTDGRIDRFWCHGRAATAAVRARYLAWLKAEALKPGDFYTPRGQTRAIRSVLAKIDSPPAQKARLLQAAT